MATRQRLNKMVILSHLIAILAFVMVIESKAAVKLPNIFGDFMVLQRNKPVPVWGWAEKGEKVTVKFAGQEKSVITGESGKWMLKLDSMKANKKPATMIISGKNSLSIKNI